MPDCLLYTDASFAHSKGWIGAVLVKVDPSNGRRKLFGARVRVRKSDIHEMCSKYPINFLEGVGTVFGYLVFRKEL